ncbi:CapA family protein [Paenibacillus sp. NPDC058071]|uniref:CapA family protein n=1 Tax=Paenibacillus sp. NPDC058071 TaxID=3346326 RepID=UPI0036DA79C2
MRRLLTLNLSMLGAIIILLAVWFFILDKGNEDLPLGQDGGGKPSQSAQQGGEPGDDVSKDDGNPSAGNGDEEAPEGNQTGNPAEGSEGATDDGGSTGSTGKGTTDGGYDDSEKVRLSFVGDILLGASVGELLQKNGYDFPYAESKLYLSEPDVMAGNLEYPVTHRGVPAEDKTFVFKGTPEALPALKNAGFDVLSLANNHTLDQGVEGLLDTMGHLDEAGIAHMGAGNNDKEAYKPVIREVRGVKIAYIGLSRVVPKVSWKADKNNPGVAETYDVTRAIAAIKDAKERADIVAVMVHWGVEKADKPEKYQRDDARAYIDAGADLVIGSHPHVLQGFETYKGKWIAYSLGNFIFSVYPKGRSGDTGVLDAVCTPKGDCELQFHPMYADMAQPKPMAADKGAELLKQLTQLSFGVKLGSDGKLSPVK